jgi:acyl dehydratase
MMTGHALLSSGHHHTEQLIAMKRLLSLSSSCPRASFSLTYATTTTRRHLSIPPIGIEGTIPREGRGIEVHQYAEVKRTFSASDVTQFGNLVGDNNPLHSALTKSDDILNSATYVPLLQDAGIIQFEEESSRIATTKPLVHGMLASSLFSCIFGTLIPGSVYRNQSLNFRKPIFANDDLVGRVDIIKVRAAPKGGLLVVCDTNVYVLEDGDQKTVCITGQANVWLPTAVKAE